MTLPLDEEDEFGFWTPTRVQWWFLGCVEGYLAGAIAMIARIKGIPEGDVDQTEEYRALGTGVPVQTFLDCFAWYDDPECGGEDYPPAPTLRDVERALMGNHYCYLVRPPNGEPFVDFDGD